MVDFSRTCRRCVRPLALAISNPPGSRITAMLGALTADLLPLRSALIDLDLEVTRLVPIFCPPRLVLPHIKFNQAILNLGEEPLLFGCGHTDPPRMGV